MDEMGEIGFQSVKGCIFGVEVDSTEHLMSSVRTGSRNTSPSRQKVIKTKPRGLLPDDWLMEVLARVPPFLIFRLKSVCRRWNSILQDSSFLSSHSRVPSHGPYLLTFWKSSQAHQCSVYSLPLKTWFKIPFGYLPDCALWLVGFSGGLVCFSGFEALSFKILVCNPLTQTWRILHSMDCNQQRQLILVVDRTERASLSR